MAKVYQLSEYDTVIADSLEQAKKHLADVYMYDSIEEMEADKVLDNPHEVDDEERLNNNKVTMDDLDMTPAEEVKWLTYSEMLALIDQKVYKAPLHFSSEH